MAYKRPGWVALSIVGNPPARACSTTSSSSPTPTPAARSAAWPTTGAGAAKGSVGLLGRAARRPQPQRHPHPLRIDWGNSGTVDAYVVELPAYAGGNRDGDLALSASASPNPVALGSPLTYTLTVRNEGLDEPSPA